MSRSLFHASRGVARVSGQVKPAKKKTPCDGPRLDVFQGERLDDIPLEARPLQGVEYKGKKGYTVHGANGAATQMVKSYFSFFVCGGCIL